MSTLLEVVLWVLLIWSALIVVVTAVLMTVDARRKRRIQDDAVTFPRMPPLSEKIGDSTFTVYTYGRDLFAAMLAEIRGAEREIFLESYIWKGDAVGEEFKRAVIEAAERGVRVHVIFDSFANFVVKRSFKRFPAPVNVLRYPFFNPWILVLRLRKTGRDHRKILVVDGKVGFVGGYNIGADYASKWRDTHLRIEGPLTWELNNAFVDFWNLHRKRGTAELPDPGAVQWEPRVRAHRNAPIHLSFPIRNMYLDAIDRASSTIAITQAYFIPDGDILAALLRAARRGVDVRVLVPEVSNHVLADWLSRGLYSQLLRGGVKILLFQGAMVHAKTATIDGRWSTIGTANIDRLSLTGNYEINAEIVDEGIAALMDEIFANDSTAARELTLEEWTSRRWRARFSEAVLVPLRPLL
ncbi:phospholipase D-like domain-containing protein [Mumia zhuanghuii]|uniref:Phosphatidylserine/phosphatidylglycerophosphate/ cardiolipin synthase family protein n=1 Tax=Mumia zhuanghuii TaxID=2585211 RepID=A0A5C4LXR0_9ACTN|nr:phospholipase D-like domain-containing protein [Mumia zhuanghuii]TNC23670.1 phosphatidylserine/phosphatidylglycerophosphate/cardiolipin synthase family protein [Mumia zhuanghuii]TNC28413.1 phosphatidylserine/phosphatidylglycerophosphate/cardiolipin synthase family protein [Mumia zhuanghuii]